MEFVRGDAREVLRTVMRCGRLLLKRPPDSEAAWYAIEPLLECREFVVRGNDPRRQATLRQMVLMVAGDCCFYLNEPADAAEYYREAFSLDGRFLVAHMYARVVVENDLAEHYSFAAQSVQRARQQWRRTLFLIRGLGYAFWFIRYGIPHPHLWKEMRECRRCCREVQRRASQI